MARAAKPAIPAKPAAVARAPAPELLDVGGDDVVAAAPDSLVVAAVPVVTVPPDVDEADVEVDTTVEPSPLVVVNLTRPPPLAPVEVLLPPALPFPDVELPAPEPAPVGIPVAVVVYVDPLLSVVVIRIPPGTSPPIVEVALLPAESFPVAMTTVLVPEGGAVVETTFVKVPDLETEVLLPVAAETAEETTEDAAARAWRQYSLPASTTFCLSAFAGQDS